MGISLGDMRWELTNSNNRDDIGYEKVQGVQDEQEWWEYTATGYYMGNTTIQINK